jgi:hypothetical protein
MTKPKGSAKQCKAPPNRRRASKGGKKTPCGNSAKGPHKKGSHQKRAASDESNDADEDHEESHARLRKKARKQGDEEEDTDEIEAVESDDEEEDPIEEVSVEEVEDSDKVRQQ